MENRPSGIQPHKQGMPPVQWSSWIWFVLLTLAMVWFWQEGPRQMGTRTIPYSQFKDYLGKAK